MNRAVRLSSYEDAHIADLDIPRLNFEDILAELSAAFVCATPDQVSPLIDLWLRRVALALDIDRASVGQLNPADGRLYATHLWARKGITPIPQAINPNEVLPWLANRIIAEEVVVINDIEELPAEAHRDLEFAQTVDDKSTVAMPLKISGAIVGCVTFDMVTRKRTWSPRTVKRLRLIAEVFGNAIERQRAVTEINDLREEMRRTSRAASLGELTASLAHELNQPLGAILSNAQAARRLLSAKKPDLHEVSAAIEEIIHDNSRAVETLRNVRALFQRGQVEMSPLDPRKILLEAQRVLSLEARSKGISIRFDFPPSLPTIVGNRIQLLEVLMNLVTNAFDSICESSGASRAVDLCARHCETGHVRVAVRDSGKGIDPEILPRLFGAFFTTKHNGMGIGLRIARSIVENHGGRLWAEPNTRRGATLVFELPVSADYQGGK